MNHQTDVFSGDFSLQKLFIKVSADAKSLRGLLSMNLIKCLQRFHHDGGRFAKKRKK